MNNHSQMLEIVNGFKKVLELRKNVLQCLCNYGVQTEGWLKAELLYFLDTLKASGDLRDFDREVEFGQGGKKIDIKLTDTNDEDAWVELKHWLIGDQRGRRFGASFYFKDNEKGIKSDVEKLKQISGNKYLIILTTANPGTDAWFEGVKQFNDKFAPLNVTPLTEPKDYPMHYFSGLLSVE